MIRLPLHMLVRPLVVGREVLDLGPSPASLDLLLEARPRRLTLGPSDADAEGFYELEQLARKAPSGVVEWLAHGAAEPPLPLPAGSQGVILCPYLLDRAPPASHGRWLDELARLLRPDGFVAFASRNSHRAAAVSEPTLSHGPGCDYFETLELLRARFGEVAVVAQSPMAGFFLSQVEPPQPASELSLVDELAPEVDEASHYVWLAAKHELPPGQRRYLLVTLPPEQLRLEPARSPAQATIETPAPLAAGPPTETHALGVAGADNERLVADNERLVADNERLVADNERLVAALDEAEATVADLSRPSHRLEQELAATRDRQATITVDRDRLREELLAERERRHRVETDQLRLNDARAELESKLIAAEAQRRTLIAEVEQLRHKGGTRLQQAEHAATSERTRREGAERLLRVVADERDQLRELVRQQLHAVNERLAELVGWLVARQDRDESVESRLQAIAKTFGIPDSPADISIEVAAVRPPPSVEVRSVTPEQPPSQPAEANEEGTPEARATRAYRPLLSGPGSSPVRSIVNAPSIVPAKRQAVRGRARRRAARSEARRRRW